MLVYSFDLIESFDWDKGNIDKNYIKHNIPNQEIEEIFFNKPLLVVKDKKHSAHEERFGVYGKTNRNKYLFVTVTIRKSKVRIISARDQNKKEKNGYLKYLK